MGPIIGQLKVELGGQLKVNKGQLKILRANFEELGPISGQLGAN